MFTTRTTTNLSAIPASPARPSKRNRAIAASLPLLTALILALAAGVALSWLLMEPRATELKPVCSEACAPESTQIPVTTVTSDQKGTVR